MKIIPMNDPYQSIINSLVRAFLKSNKQRFLVCIGGCSRSGKTTFANTLKTELNRRDIDCIIISLDNWLLGVNERRGNENVRGRYNYQKIVENIDIIIKGGTIYPPIYDPKSRLITRKKSNDGLSIHKGVCIIDGVVALDIEGLRNISDYNIFVDIEDEIRKKRLLEFYTDFKGCTLEESEDIICSREFDEVPIIKKTKIYAKTMHIII